MDTTEDPEPWAYLVPLPVVARQLSGCTEYPSIGSRVLEQCGLRLVDGASVKV